MNSEMFTTNSEVHFAVTLDSISDANLALFGLNLALLMYLKRPFFITVYENCR